MRQITRIGAALVALLSGAWLGAEFDDDLRRWWLGVGDATWYDHRVEVLADHKACPDYVFYGDSQVQIGTWDLAFGGRIANYGISGDTVPWLARRIRTDCSGATVLLIGVNDLREGASPEDIADGLSQLIARLPGATYLVETLPARAAHAGLNPDLAELNRRLRALCTVGCTFIPTWDALSDGGELREEFSHDGLHLNAAGYAVLTRRLADALNLQPQPSRTGPAPETGWPLQTGVD